MDLGSQTSETADTQGLLYIFLLNIRALGIFPWCLLVFKRMPVKFALKLFIQTHFSHLAEFHWECLVGRHHGESMSCAYVWGSQQKRLPVLEASLYCFPWRLCGNFLNPTRLVSHACFSNLTRHSVDMRVSILSFWAVEVAQWGKTLALWAWWLWFDPWDSHSGRRGLTPTVALSSTCMPLLPCMLEINKINWNILNILDF